MYIGQMGTYLIGGATALRCIKQAMTAAGRSDVENVLDLPCGFGRVLRILKAAFPGARFTACDINRDGVDFCARTFDARPVYSAFDPSEVELGERFDLIWVGSLFTHLDGDRWPVLLDLLLDSLVPGGLLVFTTFGRLGQQRLRIMTMEDDQIERMLADYDNHGFGFQGFSWDPHWGMTITSADWVRQQIAERPAFRLVSHAEQAWRPPTPGQDVFACVREEEERQ
jgi:SAM-dependent methyltransferase